jgi:RNA polymerase sigma factor (TIGR02999 family)
MEAGAMQGGRARLRLVGNRGSITVLRDRREERMASITLLLQRVREGEQAARDSLFELAYDSLKSLARARLRGGGRGANLNTTMLVHEAYLRFVNSGELRADDRRAFFAYASSVMRSVVVDNARERLAERRGGDLMQVTLSTQIADSVPAGDEAILQVHEALIALAEADPRAARVVEMRYFGGYTEQEIADALDIDVRTVNRDWQKARLLLEVALK